MSQLLRWRKELCAVSPAAEIGFLPIVTEGAADDWRHTITIEATAAADPAMDYPRYLYGARRAPPEDVGGIPGFELFLEAIADPNRKEYDELIRWYGAPFDPALVDEDVIRARIEKLARRRTIGKAAFAKSRGQIN
ncbi:plasmid pRiA4b ORF-3 family protein [Ancylobacter oerskovii]|uniref:Plasmid pRiA4b ORF-3 family protein n=1 Tax=Ancylobacter oerskovii TaxID=459519 RepID=A0ABW4Z4H8_9HYPH